MNDPLSFMRHPSIPPVLGIPNTLPPHVIYKPNNQEINYKQNVIVRWLKLLLHRLLSGVDFLKSLNFFRSYSSFRNPTTTHRSASNYLSTVSPLPTGTTANHRSVTNKKKLSNTKVNEFVTLFVSTENNRRRVHVPVSQQLSKNVYLQHASLAKVDNKNRFYLLVFFS